MNVFLKNANYRRFSFASFLSSAGDILFYLAFMTYASKLQNYSLALSLIAISESIPRLLEIFGGYLADRTKNKFRNIFLCAVIRFALYSIVGILFVTNISQWGLVIAIVVINFFSDTTGSYSGGLVAPLIVDLVGKEEYGEAEGFTNGIGQVINMTAQFAGSALLLVMSYSSLAFLNAATFLLAGILYASVGLKNKKGGQVLETKEVNDQKFFATMKSSFVQVRKQNGLLTTVLIIALLNGSLSAIEPLTTIVLAAHRSTMVIGTYSFTLALISTITGIGFVLGTMFGPQLLKKVSIFALAIISNVLSIVTTISVLLANTYLILGFFFFLAAVAGVASIKLQQWLVNAVDHKILASTVGLLSTILSVASPLMTSVLTTISGGINVNVALIVLIIVEGVTLGVAVMVALKQKQLNKADENVVAA